MSLSKSLHSSNFWVLKTEPEEYSWQDMKRDTVTTWDGVRNYEARNYMKQMKLGDLAFFYHTGNIRCIEGIVEVVRTYYSDDTNPTFGIVDVKYKQEISSTISLKQIKATKELQDILLIKRPRLSVLPIAKEEADLILKMVL